MELDPVIKKMDFKGDGHPFGFGLSPEADWKVILVATIVLSLAVSAINLFMFVGVDKGEIFTVDITESSDAPSFDLDALKSANEYYSQKSEAFEAIKAEGASVPDPSI
jgi:hypothetical protein